MNLTKPDHQNYYKECSIDNIDLELIVYLPLFLLCKAKTSKGERGIFLTYWLRPCEKTGQKTSGF